MEARILHWVFKVADRQRTIWFCRNVLGMAILRHEEFTEGCDAQCNGPYDGKWSKTMVGYGAEDSHFVLELTYNYGVKEYDVGNDFNAITISSTSAYANCQKHKEELALQQVSENTARVTAPGGYQFEITNSDVEAGDPVTGLVLNATNLDNTTKYWQEVLGMKEVAKADSSVTFAYGDGQATLTFVQQEGVEHGTAYGRVAFATPAKELAPLEAKIRDLKYSVHTPLVSLDTPGKATVEVVILADVDGYEICFVGAEAFLELSQVDPQGEALLDEAMASDKSDEWWEKRKAFLQKLDGE